MARTIWVKFRFTKNNGEPAEGIVNPQIIQAKRFSDDIDVIPVSQSLIELGKGAYKFNFTSLFDDREDYDFVGYANDSELDSAGYAYGGNELIVIHDEDITRIADAVENRLINNWSGTPL